MSKRKFEKAPPRLQRRTDAGTAKHNRLRGAPPTESAGYIAEIFAELEAQMSPEEKAARAVRELAKAEVEAKKRAAEARARKREERERKQLAKTLGKGWERPDHMIALYRARDTMQEAKGRTRKRGQPSWSKQQLEAEVARVVREIEENRMLPERPGSRYGVTPGEVCLALCRLPANERPPDKWESLLRKTRAALRALAAAGRLSPNEATGDQRFTPSLSTASTHDAKDRTSAYAAVTLDHPDGYPRVRGKKKRPLSAALHDIIKALLDAPPEGLTGPELDKASGHESAKELLRRLVKKDGDWERVIVMAERPGHRYRIGKANRTS